MACHAARAVTEEQLGEMMKVFAAADKDGDGVLTAEEYKTAFHEHGLHVDEEWVNVMMSKIDLNGDGGISIDDFVEFNAKNQFAGNLPVDDSVKDQEYLKMRKVQTAFKIYDKNKDGFITRREFKSVSRRLSSGQVEAVFKSYDKNKDDKLSYDEFQSFMLHYSS